MNRTTVTEKPVTIPTDKTGPHQNIYKGRVSGQEAQPLLTV